MLKVRSALNLYIYHISICEYTDLLDLHMYMFIQSDLHVQLYKMFIIDSSLLGYSDSFVTCLSKL